MTDDQWGGLLTGWLCYDSWSVGQSADRVAVL